MLLLYKKVYYYRHIFTKCWPNSAAQKSTNTVSEQIETRLDSRWRRCRRWESHRLFLGLWESSCRFYHLQPTQLCSRDVFLRWMKFTEAPANHWTPGNILDAETPVLPMMLHRSARVAEAHRLCGGVWCVGEQTKLPQRAAAICLHWEEIFTRPREDWSTRERILWDSDSRSLCGALQKKPFHLQLHW